jgi:hypothetical protein
MRRISAMMAAPVALSRLAVGSSASTSAGAQASARAIATRWRCPPESWPGRRPPKSTGSARPTAASSSRTRSRRRAGLAPVSRSGYSMFSAAVSTGSRLKFWNTKPRWRARKSASASSLRACSGWPATMTSPEFAPTPASGRSMPPIRFSRVVLPLPEGPLMTVKQLARIVRSMSRRAGTPTLSRW